MAFPNVFRACEATTWNELLDKPILPREVHLCEVARSFAYFCDDRRLLIDGKVRSNKRISIYRCEGCSWMVKFTKRNGAVAKDDPWFLDSWGTTRTPQAHEAGCSPEEVLTQGEVLRNSPELREYLSTNRGANKNEIVAFMLTKNIDLRLMGNSSVYKARDNILGLLLVDDHDGDSVGTDDRSASSSQLSRHDLRDPLRYDNNEPNNEAPKCVGQDQAPGVGCDVDPNQARTMDGLPDGGSTEDATGLLDYPATANERSMLNDPSVGTFSASNDSDRGSRGDRMHSMEPSSKTVRFTPENTPNTEGTEHSTDHSVAPDSPMNSTRGEDRRRSHGNPRQSLGTKVRAMSQENGTKLSAALTNLEIAVEPSDDMSSTAFGYMTSKSVDRMLLDLSKPSLHPNEIKGFLDELLDRTINEDRQLKGQQFLDRAVGVVSTVMDSNLKDTSVLLRALRFVGQLYDNLGGFQLHGNNESIHVLHDFVEQTLRILCSHGTDVNLSHQVLSFLRALTARDFDAESVIAKANGVNLILNHMNQHSNEFGIQEEACFLLGRLLNDYPETTQLMLAKLNGVDPILQAMQRYEENADIQGLGCYALHESAVNYKVNQRAMVDANGVEVIHRALLQYPDSTAVQTFGSKLLKWLKELGNFDGMSSGRMLSELSKTTVKVNQIKLLLDELSIRTTNGGRSLQGQAIADQATEAVANVMERHAKDTNVLSKALDFAIQLFRTSDLDSIHASDHVIAQTLRVLQLHHSNAGLVYHVLSLLGTLTVCNFKAEVGIAKANGIELILSGMRQHSNHAGIQKAGCVCLGDLAYINPRNQHTIADSNGIALILQAMQRHEKNETVQARGCRALYWLADDHEMNQRAMIEANGVEVIRQAVGDVPLDWWVAPYSEDLLKWLQELEPLKNVPCHEH